MFLSLIVPVYNTEAWLAECLESLLHQDIPAKDYEILCINDGSTDKSGAILQAYQNAHENIRVLEQENSGVAAARNAGMDAAAGEYLWFVDSDDFIAQNCLQELRKETEASHPDILDFGAYTFTEAFSEEERAAYLQNQLPPNSFANHVYITRSLFRKAFLSNNSIAFDTRLAYSEDSLFHCQCLLCAPWQQKIRKAYSFVRFRHGSAIARTDNTAVERKLESWCIAAEAFQNIYCRCDEKLKGKLADLLMGNLWSALSVIAGLPGKKACQSLKKMREMGLFPCSRPKECTLKRSYQTTRTDLPGRLFDWIYIHTHTVPGFYLMLLWNCAYSLYRSLRKALHKIS